MLGNSAGIVSVSNRFWHVMVALYIGRYSVDPNRFTLDLTFIAGYEHSAGLVLIHVIPTVTMAKDRG